MLSLLRTSTLSQLIEHLNSGHNCQISTEKHTFNCWSEFDAWKAKEEKQTNSYYVRDSSAKVHGLLKHYFYCNRSGNYESKGHTKRQLKLQGSCKTASTCIAHIKVVQNTSTDEVAVEYCSIHNSHDTNLCHLPVPQDIKLLIAAKLQDGVSLDRILDDVRNSSVSPRVGRQHLVTKQDINNIKKCLI